MGDSRPSRSVALCVLLATIGCVVPTLPKGSREPARELPDDFGVPGAPGVPGGPGALGGLDGVADGAPEVEPVTQLPWRELFDPRLAALIDVALRNNQELNILSLEIGISRYEIHAREGEYLPALGFGAGAGVEKVGERTSQGAADEANDVPEDLQDYSVGFFATWEVDVWKKLRNATKAATLRYLASVEGRRFAVTHLVAEIASSYYELLALDNELEVLEQNIQIQSDALEIVKLQKQAARVTELAVKRFEAEVFKNQSRRFSIRQRIIETENRLNFLVGRFPQAIERDATGFLDREPQQVQSGVPSQLLQNRPDVRRAELQLAAAELDVEVARARFYPSLEIEAGIGYESYELHHLAETPESVFYGLAAGLSAPVLNRRGIEADYRSADAMQMQAVQEYERTLLAAYNEVANHVAMIDNLDRSFELRSREVERLTDSIEISSGLFTSARADYMEVLLTRRDALDAQMELIETKEQRMSAMVHLYQALGGGWREPEGSSEEQEAGA